MYRTHTCGELRISDVGAKVTLSGWVQRVRDLGGMTFIDLRDRYGITQLAIDTEKQAELGRQARELGREFVIQVVGEVAERSSKNSKIPTGDIELILEQLTVLNKSALPPFTIEDETDGGEELRMKYRYLDLRRNPVRRNLELRHQMGIEIRNYLNDKGFLDVETPVLIKSTPEGARDFVVPSRVHPGQFYALPQSPQIFKQLLMVAGMERYFQIVRCFRDEDLRADRQPEFTQIDIEVSFMPLEPFISLMEEMVAELFEKTIGAKVERPFPRITYREAMERYGSDKPDLRFGMELVDLSEAVKDSSFKVFSGTVARGGRVKALNVKGC